MEPRGYRMVVAAGRDFVATAASAERALDAWLAWKRYDEAALDEGRTEIARNVTLDRDSASGRHGAYTRWRMRETREGGNGTWQSTLIVRADHREDDRRTWVQVDVEHRPALPDVRPRRAGTPRIAGLLLDTLDARDGRAAVAARSVVVGADDVDAVVGELCDQGRRLPVVVASVPYGREATAWNDEVVDQAFGHLPGLAIMYVLTAEAQTAFNRAAEFHPVFGGGIRTYLPGIDLAWKPDAQRHPVMSRATVEANPRRAASILAALPQRFALRQQLPAPLATLPVQRTRPRPSVRGSDTERLRSENQTLTAMLTEAEQTEAARADEISELRGELMSAEYREFELLGERDELYTELRRERERVRALRICLEQAGRPESAHVPPADESPGCPASFAELLDAMRELPNLMFTGSAKKARELDDQSVANWVEMAWDALLALQDFAAESAAGRADGDFRAWCARRPSGAHCFSAGKVRMKESDTVGGRKEWKRQRTFPVPVEVDRSGFLYMEAHLRIGGGNTVAPRLYFYDDGPHTGRVYVGYIGPHLTNTMS